MHGLKLRLKALKSFQLRIFMILIVVSIVPMIILGMLIRNPISQSFVNTKMDRLLSQCNIIRNHLISEDYLETQKTDSTGAEQEQQSAAQDIKKTDSINAEQEQQFTTLNSRKTDAIDAELAQLSAMYDGRILIINDQFIIVKDTYVMDEGKTSVSGDVIRCYRGENLSSYNDKDHYIQIALALTDEDKNVIGVMLVTFSTMDVKENMDKIENRMFLAESIIGILMFMVSFFLARKLVKPFDKIEASIDKISNGYFDEKLSLDGYKETEEIADAFNTMLLKMKKLDESRQEFVSNVSHELKTPITSIKVLADSLLMQDEVPNEIYKEFFTDIVAEVDRENEIITDLLTMVRLDKKNTTLNFTAVNINELVEVILKRLGPIAAKRNIEVVLESFRPIVADIDEVKFNSAITNLVENAIKYNVIDGWVRVTLNADHRYFYIKVADSGIGIPEDSQELIFDRFYRVDKTRARETGGTGLGLAITKNIIILHDGAIKVYSKEGEGTTFTVRIPLNHITDSKEQVQTIMMDNA